MVRKGAVAEISIMVIIEVGPNVNSVRTVAAK